MLGLLVFLRLIEPQSGRILNLAALIRVFFNKVSFYETEKEGIHGLKPATYVTGNHSSAKHFLDDHIAICYSHSSFIVIPPIDIQISIQMPIKDSLHRAAHLVFFEIVTGDPYAPPGDSANIKSSDEIVRKSPPNSLDHDSQAIEMFSTLIANAPCSSSLKLDIVTRIVRTILNVIRLEVLAQRKSTYRHSLNMCSATLNISVAISFPTGVYNVCVCVCVGMCVEASRLADFSATASLPTFERCPNEIMLDYILSTHVQQTIPEFSIRQKRTIATCNELGVYVCIAGYSRAILNIDSSDL
ncbi:hypothetical protein C0J52_22788 [Blattella germanica]|nr:hypothetical protein C0J52_22788 [Blattella germanica]